MRTGGEYPSPEELTTAANILGRLPSGRLPLGIFLQFSRLATLSVVEVVPLNRTPELNVLLLQRPDDDPYWPSVWHSPGSIILPTDREGTTYQDAIERVIRGELRNPKILRGPIQFGNGINKEERGTAAWVGFWVEVTEAPVGEFFSVDRLPENLIKGHTELIDAAARSFRKRLLMNES
ncbi:hypothetical protein HYW44_01710 [Candidatus Daviesbacteria bacterium]|nr:hypothetical protein [Candidatus Daviesbacteria bacterium]